MLITWLIMMGSALWSVKDSPAFISCRRAFAVALLVTATRRDETRRALSGRRALLPLGRRYPLTHGAMHVVDEALEPQGLRRRGLGVDAREEEPGTIVDVAELGFAGVDERPQVRDGHVGTQVGWSPLPSLVSYSSASQVAKRP